MIMWFISLVRPQCWIEVTCLHVSFPPCSANATHMRENVFVSVFLSRVYLIRWTNCWRTWFSPVCRCYECHICFPTALIHLILCVCLSCPFVFQVSCPVFSPVVSPFVTGRSGTSGALSATSTLIRLIPNSGIMGIQLHTGKTQTMFLIKTDGGDIGDVCSLAWFSSFSYLWKKPLKDSVLMDLEGWVRTCPPRPSLPFKVHLECLTPGRINPQRGCNTSVWPPPPPLLREQVTTRV